MHNFDLLKLYTKAEQEMLVREVLVVHENGRVERMLLWR